MPKKPANTIDVATYTQENRAILGPFASVMRLILGSFTSKEHIQLFLKKLDALKIIAASGPLSIDNIVRILGKHRINRLSGCSITTLKKNLNSLITLTTSLPNTESITPPITPLSLLLDKNLRPEEVAHILNGPSKDLEDRVKHVQVLTSPFTQNGMLLLDSEENVVCQLTRIIKEGFDKPALVSFLHGTNGRLDASIEQLLKLVMPLDQTEAWAGVAPEHTPSSALRYLLNHISLTKLACWLKQTHNNGTPITEALLALASPLRDTEGRPLFYDQHFPITKLTHLLKSGLTLELLIDYIGGTFTTNIKARMEALLALTSPAYSCYGLPLRKTDDTPFTQWEYLTIYYTVPSILAQLSVTSNLGQLNVNNLLPRVSQQGTFAYTAYRPVQSDPVVNHSFTPSLSGGGHSS